VRSRPNTLESHHEGSEAAPRPVEHGTLRSASGSRLADAVCILMLGAPFLLLAGVYNQLRADVPVIRNPLAGTVMIAPKSMFTVFRVPFMNLTHGLMAALMRSHGRNFEDAARRSSYLAMFSTLLFAIALKSDFEALEISGLASQSGPFGHWAAAGTAVSVVAGVVLALVRGRRVPIPWPELRLSVRDKVILAGLFLSYLAVVTASLLVAH
jgi:hypothetical protein